MMKAWRCHMEYIRFGKVYGTIFLVVAARLNYNRPPAQSKNPFNKCIVYYHSVKGFWKLKYSYRPEVNYFSRLDVFSRLDCQM